MASWYLAYKNGSSTVMHVYAGRDDAIAAACELLERGCEVTEVAPMAGELPEGGRLDATQLKRLREHRGASRCAPQPSPV